ncbi:MAG: hypothetical protein H7A44_02705 [Opitutaceae bacterium]|nr:hypothetical protein [Opitutaceae bacterium]
MKQTPPRLAPFLLCLILLPGIAPALWSAPPVAPEVERLMGLAAGEHAVARPRPDSPRTAFFLAEAYNPRFAVPADAIQLYAGLEDIAPIAGPVGARSSGAVARSWVERGYAAQLFLHSRYGAADATPPALIQTGPADARISVFGVYDGDKRVDIAVGALTPELRAEMTRRHGTGIEIRAFDHYTIPTVGRIEQARADYGPVEDPAFSAFCFDEPEIWARAGYSAAFKAEWKAYYGSDWVAPDSSVDARYRAERLKTHLVRRWVEGLFDGVRRLRPDIPLMLALHSQPSYANIGVGAPHHALFEVPGLREVVAEVWNESFANCYLQYSSFRHLTRGTGKTLWLMMDPWGDSPAMSLDYYRKHYGDNVLAALMFPTEEHYQPLIWPNRLYGKIPRDYERLINTVTGVLADLWLYPDGRVEAGSPGIATLTSDTMGMQRAEPSPSDLEGYLALAQPLMERGVPVEVLSLERVAEPGYLDGTKCLVMSYDFLKPQDRMANQALVDWVKGGGSLVFFGGTDAYNAVQDSWWRRDGYATPFEALMSGLGLAVGEPQVLDKPGEVIELEGTDAGLGLPALTIRTGPTPGEAQYRLRVSSTQTEDAAAKQPSTYPVTLYPPPAGATVLGQTRGTGQPVAWRARAGRGQVIFAGVSPGGLQEPGGPAWLRGLAREGLAAAGGDYRESARFLVRRGPFTGVHTEAESFVLRGRYFDLLSPGLDLVENPEIAPQSNALYRDAEAASPGAGMPCVSGRLRSYVEQPGRTAFVVQAPEGTDGAARVLCRGRKVGGVSAFTTTGEPVAVQSAVESGSLALTYPNVAAGVVVRVDWAESAGAQASHESDH